MIATIFQFAATALAGHVLVALGLIASARPRGPQPSTGGLDFSGIGGGPLMPEPRGVAMRDGYALQVRDYANDAGPVLILLHGSGWNGLQFNRLAPFLQAHGRVLVPDLRGHGAAPGRRGDVDHVGQLEEDIADLIDGEAQGRKVVLIGHSSGGGLVVRMAGGAYGARIDGAVLMAPFLQHDAPTTRRNSGGWARPLTRRLIGLSMLNMFGIRVLNHLSVIEFDMPTAVLSGPLGHLATTAYSWRLNQSYAPRRKYLRDIAALPPFLLLAGDADEAFDAPAYEPLMRQVTDRGRYRIVPGAGHLGLVDNERAQAEIAEFLDAL